MNRIICGVDVSKDWLDAHVWPGGAAERFANDATGIAALWLFCRSHGAALAVMEASGGYERLGFMLLWAHGMPCGVVNARSVRRFAEAMGYLEKTDRIDAAVIAHYGAVKKTVPTPPPSAAQQRLAALVGRLCQIVGDATVNKQRRSAARDAETCASIEAMLAFLKREQRRLEGEIASMIDDDPLWARLEQAFRSLKGVAGRTVARLMAELPRSALSPTKPSPSWLASPPSPTTAAGAPATGMCAADAPGHVASSSSSQPSWRSSIPISKLSLNGCNRRGNLKCSSASHSPENFSSSSMQKHATREASSRMQLDTPDSRSPPTRMGARNPSPPGRNRAETTAYRPSLPE